jgi:spore coat polysaccharide biosynthesis protein SpsF
MKVGAIIQARMTSSRLPGKILLPIPYSGKISSLEHVIKRIKKCKLVDCIVVATTTSKKDQIIVSIANKEKVAFFKGSELNVLKRYYYAAKKYKLSTIVRITSDSPFIDYHLIDQAINKLVNDNSDFCSNSLRKPYNHGMNVEVFTFDALKRAYFGATKNYEREHVCPYFYLSHPENFKISEIFAPKYIYMFPVRITLDTWDDYIFLCAIADYLYNKNHYFTLSDIMNLLKRKPWIKEINLTTEQNKINTKI